MTNADEGMVSVVVPAEIAIAYVARKYEGKGDDRVLLWEKDFGTYRFSPADLPTQTVAFALEYGLRQIGADAFARAKSADEANTLFLERMLKVQQGTLGTRAAKSPEKALAQRAAVNPLIAIIGELRGKEIRAKTAKVTGLATQPGKADKEGRKAWDAALADATLAALGKAEWLAEAQAEYDRRQDALAAIAAESDTLDLDF